MTEVTDIFESSWRNDEELEELARLARTEEITKGAVQSVAFRKVQLRENGKSKDVDVEVVLISLHGGNKVYCLAKDFSEREYRSLIGFVGTMQEFVVTHIDLNNQIAFASVIKADAVKRNIFWSELDYLKQKGELATPTYKGKVNGYNPKTERIFIRVNGVDCFMVKYDWDHGRIGDVSAHVERGTEVEVKVSRFDKERGIVQVSRKDAMNDPFDLLEQMKDTQAVAGKISDVHPIHGIFVQLDVGLEVKGTKPAHIEEPVVGDYVTCKIRTIDRKRRHCKVVIIGYPRGKKKRKDIGSFLFE